MAVLPRVVTSLDFTTAGKNHLFSSEEYPVETVAAIGGNLTHHFKVYSTLKTLFNDVFMTAFFFKVLHSHDFNW